MSGITQRRRPRGTVETSEGARHLPSTGVYADLYDDVSAISAQLDEFMAQPRVTMSQVEAAIQAAVGDVDARITAAIAGLDLVTRAQVIQMIQEYLTEHPNAGGITATQVQELIDTAVSDALNTAY